MSGGLGRQVALLARIYGVLHALIEAVERAENRNLDVAVVVSDGTDDIEFAASRRDLLRDDLLNLAGRYDPDRMGKVGGRPFAMLSLSWARTQFTVCWSPSQMSAGRPVRGVIVQATTRRGAKTTAKILPTVTRISSLAIVIDCGPPG